MGIFADENEAGCSIRLEGNIDISSAAGLKAQLADALNKGKQLSVSLAQAQYIDVTAIQLIWSAGQKARRCSIGFSLSGHSIEPLSALLADAGIPPFPESMSSSPGQGQ